MIKLTLPTLPTKNCVLCVTAFEELIHSLETITPKPINTLK